MAWNNTTLLLLEVAPTAYTVQSLIINMVLGMLAFTLNTISFLFVHLSRTLPTKQKVVLTSLILTDGILGFQIIVSRGIPFIYTSDDVLCHIKLYSGLILAYVTLFSNLLITMERLLSLTRPLETWITWQKIAVVTGSLWIISPLIIFSTFYEGFAGLPVCQFFVVGNPVGYIFIGITILIIYMVIVGIYIYIVKVTRRHIRQIASTMVGGPSANDGRRYLNKAELRSTVTVGVILGCFGISYVPMAAYCIYSSLFIDDLYAHMSNNNRLFALGLHFFQLNSLINPLVYFWRLKNCRREMTSRILCRPHRPVVTNANP